MERTVEQLKERIRAGGAKIPAEKVIKNGQLVNVMTSEIYPAEIAIYKDMIAAVGDEAEVADYIGPDTQIIDAKGRFLVPGMIDGHIHSECSKLSITSYAKAVVPHGTTSMISGLDEYISVSDLDGLQAVSYTHLDVYKRQLNMQQAELAELVGVRRETIGKLENGKYNPSLKLAMEIAKVFGKTVEEIFQFEENDGN